MQSVQKILFLLFTLQIRKSSCECRETYTVTCDTLFDLENYNIQEWTDLVIGSVAENSVVKVKLTSTGRPKIVSKLRRLTIINQLTELQDILPFVLPNLRSSKLQCLVLYKNNIDTIRKSSFHLREMIFVDNKIKNVDENAFRGVEFVDLSHNLLEAIKSKVFGEGIDTVILRNNNIVYIADDAFAATLTILNLDSNKLVHLQTQIFNNLPNLKELILSHNNIFKMVTFPTLVKLWKIDLSFNQLETINDNHFNYLPWLSNLDLNNNKISGGPALSQVPSKTSALQINLSYNLLRKLENGLDTNLSRPYTTLLLYGNPWECDSWHDFEKVMVKNHIHRSPCDVELFGNGKMPYCINYSYEQYPDRYEQKRKIFEHFHAVLNKKKTFLPCELTLDTYQKLQKRTKY